jgi:hypothetical protein
VSNLGSVRGKIVLPILAALCGLGVVATPPASAEPLEAVTGPVTETVTGPVDEVVESLPPPVQEATETVTAPVQEAPPVPPPAQEVTETATAPVEAVKETVTPPVKTVTEAVAPPAKAVTEAVRNPSAPAPAKPPSSPTTRVTETAGAVSRGLPTSRRSSPSAPDPASSQAGAPRQLADHGSVAPLSVDRAGGPRGNRFVPSPATDGSIGAPLPKWMAYIWPAIALLRPGLTELMDHLEAAARIALGISGGFGGKAGSGPVVAGLHASGGPPGKEGSSTSPSPSSPSSSSPLSRISTAVGDFPYNGAGAVLAYLLIMAIMAIAIYGAVRWEIARGRRERRD